MANRIEQLTVNNGLTTSLDDLAIKDDNPGGTNLELTHSYYELDKIMGIIKNLNSY